jgi:asparagine synthase (glutamine-hydrolysing)
MCGIGGLYFNDGTFPDNNILLEMQESIIHRGPDSGSHVRIDSCGLLHRRLSILDLSSGANQPLSSSDERYWIVYNGEVYNYLELKRELVAKGYLFKTSSDTEVVLSAYIEYGTSAFDRLNGMFALAIYDKMNSKLVLARDRFGIKPLYTYTDYNKFIFGSEIKVIRSYPGLRLSISEQALSEYIWYGNPLGINTIYSEINELDPGTYLCIDKKGATFNKYTTFKYTAPKYVTKYSEHTKYLLEAAVKRHLISDVPVGVFLSGGIDSSAITAFASQHVVGDLNSYSVRFDFDKGSNELPLAAKVAKKFNTKHHEIIVSGNDVIEVLESLVKAHDEPFGDAANIPLYLMTKQLSGKVKVVLQGDGGDEFFGGYNRYKIVANLKIWGALRFVEPLFSSFNFESTRLLRLQRFIYAVTRRDAAERHALLLTMESLNTCPLQVFNHRWKKKIEMKDPFLQYRIEYENLPKKLSDLDSLFFVDSKIILKDTFFEKVDKSTMANSIEVRVPFVDLELANWSLSLPGNVKMKGGELKGLLKAALRNVVPDEILDGKKKGFGVPYEIWLKTSLKSYFIDQVNSSEAKQMLNHAQVMKLFNLHCNGKGNYGFLLWKVLILSIWLNKIK